MQLHLLYLMRFSNLLKPWHHACQEEWLRDGQNESEECLEYDEYT